MTYLQAVMLECLHKINGERTIYSIYHLLTGKKSSQTIQDAHLYQLTHLFKTHPGLKRREYDSMISVIDKKDYLHFLDNPQKCQLTDVGRQALHTFFNRRPLPQYINGWKYQDASIHLWQRLTLIIQVTSHLVRENNRYYPIQRNPDTYLWAKNFFKSFKGSRDNLSKSLYKELHAIFSGEFPENPLFIVSRLSGYEWIGLTSKQTAEQNGLEETEYRFRFINCLHYMIQAIISEKTVFPVLYSLLSDVFQPVPYTRSTLRTYDLLRQNMTIDQIAAIRSLRQSTIEDHIIEIALSDQFFVIDDFIEPSVATEILQFAKRLGQKKLKPIKEQFQHVSYFQIRLVLAKSGEKI